MTGGPEVVTRFAPSPTGPLHLGHAYAAFVAHDIARRASGRFLLRIEDIDRDRSRAEWEEAIHADLDWLGITPDGVAMRQSDRIGKYRDALQTLWSRGLLYACECNRADIRAAISAPQEGDGWTTGPDGLVYPGLCASKGLAAGPSIPEHHALRLNINSVMQVTGFPKEFSFTESGQGPNGETGCISFDLAEFRETIGDIVVARRDFGTSYHLSVVLDDAAQGITHVTRGADLFEATPIHVLLQRLIGLPTPIYHHHRLIRDETGKRLAKRDDARAISEFRRHGATPAEIRAMVGLS